MQHDGYPALRAFLGAWFHQDFDLVGDTLDAIVADYVRSARPDERRLLQADIRHFLQQATGHVDAEFERQFAPDFDPAGFAADARDFLLTMDRLLEGNDDPRGSPA